MRIIFIFILTILNVNFGKSQIIENGQPKPPIINDIPETHSRNQYSSFPQTPKFSIIGKIINIETGQGVDKITIKSEDAQTQTTTENGDFYIIFHSKKGGECVNLKIDDNNLVVFNPNELKIIIPNNANDKIYYIQVCSKKSYDYHMKMKGLWIYHQIKTH